MNGAVAAVAYNYFLRQVRIMSIEMEEFEYDFIHLLQKRRRKVQPMRGRSWRRSPS